MSIRAMSMAYPVWRSWHSRGGPRRAGLENELGDLGWAAEPHRRPPVARAVADVDERTPETHETRGDRLLQPHQVVERPDLPAVGVPRNLQADPGPFRFDHGTRLVREQHHLARLVPPRQRTFEIGAVAVAEVPPREIVDARQVEAVLVVADADPFVAQHAHTELAQVRAPLLDPGV